MGLMKKSILFINGCLLLACICIAVISYFSASAGFQVSLLNKADSDMKQAEELLDVKYPGAWRLEKGILYKGEQRINDNEAVVDWLSQLSGNNVTLFAGDTRVATTFQQNGKRQVGTQASPEVLQKVLAGGDYFTGEAEILGSKYFCAYEPIQDASGQNVGMVFIGIPQRDIQVLQQSFIQRVAICTVILLVLFAFVIGYAVRWLVRRIDYVRVFMRKLADGDMSIDDLVVRASDEMGDMVRLINIMKKNVTSLLQHISESASHVAAASEEMTASANQTAESVQSVAGKTIEMAENTSQQSHQLDQTNQQAELVRQQVLTLHDNSQVMHKVANDSMTGISEGNQAVNDAVQAMENISNKMKESSDVVTQLGQRSSKVGDIIATISSIAEQTNLLALNAAIEASHAGAAGRGFAVVAEEVRKLAEQSQEASQNIAEMIGQIREDVECVVQSMAQSDSEVTKGRGIVDHTGEVFVKINSYMDKLYEEIEQSMGAIQQVDQSVKDMSSYIRTSTDLGLKTADNAQNISASTEEQTSAMHEISRSSEALAGLAKQLEGEVGKFKIK